VPHRTLVVSDAVTEAEDQYTFTFDSTTRPTATQVESLIADACAWVGARLAPVHVSSQGAARVVATLASAAAVERSWPNDDESLQRANDLEKRMGDILAGLLVSNELANAGDGDPETIDTVLPVWSFPLPDPRYDDPRYF